MWIGFPNVGGRAIPSQRYSEARATVGDGGDAQASRSHHISQSCEPDPPLPSSPLLCHLGRLQLTQHFLMGGWGF
jgi:hypothetical protein